MPRTNIAVDERVADDLSDEANAENKSLYALTNEALTSVLRVCKFGGNPSEIYSAWRFVRILKDLDAIPLPGDLMESLISRVYLNDKDWLLSQWFEQGKRVGSYLHMFAEDFKTLVVRIEELKGLLPFKRIEFERTEAGGTISVAIRVLGTGLTPESTACTEQFLRGILSNYPYKITWAKSSAGFIEIRGVEEKPKTL
jgi:hypothetical protein